MNNSVNALTIEGLPDSAIQADPNIMYILLIIIILGKVVTMLWRIKTHKAPDVEKQKNLQLETLV